MNTKLLPVLSLGLIFALACGGGGETTTTTETTPPPPPPPAAADGAIGVPECDDYLKKVDECLGKLDATSKAAFESSSKQTVDAWRQAAATPEGKAGLAQGCKMAVDMFQCPAAPAGTPTDATGAPGTPAGGTTTTPGATAPAGGTGTATETPAATGTKAPPSGAKAPPRDDRPVRSMERTRDGSGSGSRDGKSGSGDKKEEGGMGRSR